MPTVKELIVKQTASGIKNTTEQIEAQNEALRKGAAQAKAQQDKHEKGAAGMAKNSTASFAKMSQGLGGLVHVYATVAANVFALSSAFLVLKNAMDIDIMIASAEQLSVSTGVSYANVAASMKEVTQGALSMEESLRAASIGISSGLSGDQMQQLAEIATKAANALGRSVPEAINRMTQAVVKNEPELVDEYGIILRVDEATKDYAQTLGKTKAELTTFDRQMAIHAQLVKQGTSKFGNIEEQVNAYNKLGATFAEMSHSLVSFINDGLAPLANLLSENQGLLAGIAAIFAKGVFNKAVPELQNITENLKIQRAEYANLIAQKSRAVESIGLGVESSAEFDIKYLDKESLNKQADTLVKSMPFSELEDEFNTSIAKGIKDGSKRGSKHLKIATKGFTIGLDNALEKLSTSNAKLNKEGREYLNNNNQTVASARQLVTIHKILSGELKQHSIDVAKTVTYEKSKTEWLQKQLLLIQQQRLVAKDAQTAAFAAGSTGGFLGGGLAEANKAIAARAASSNKSFSLIQSSGIRIAGIFGNITGILGGIMSLVSGWGIALFAVTQFALPLADAFGITNKAARETEEAIDKAAESMNKLIEASTKLDSTNLKTLANVMDNTTAKANNLREQINLIKKLALDLGTLDTFSIFGDSDRKDAINDIQKMALQSFAKEGLEIPISFTTNLSKVADLGKLIDDSVEIVGKLSDEYNKAAVNSTKRLSIAHKISVEQKKQVVATRNQQKVLKDTFKVISKIEQARRDEVSNISKAENAIDALSKAEIKKRKEYAKSTPYFEEIENLKNIQNLIIKNGTISNNANKVAKAYAEKTGAKEVKEAEDFVKFIDQKLKKVKELSNIELDTKTRQKQIETGLLLIEDSISNKSKETLLKKIELNKELVVQKIKILEVTRAEELIAYAVAKSDQERASALARINNINMSISALSISNDIANRKILRTYNDQTDTLNRNKSIVNSEKSILESKLQVAKKAGDLSLEYTLERAKAGKEILGIDKEIALLNEASKNKEIDRAKNDASILALKEKQLTIEKLTTIEFGKQAEILAKIKKEASTKQDISKIGSTFFEKKAVDIQTQIDILESTGDSNIDLGALNKVVELTKEKHKWEVNASKAAITAAVSKRKEAKDILKNDIEEKNIIKNILAVREAELDVVQAQSDLVQLRINNEELLYEAALKTHELAKQQTNAATIFEDPKGFTDLLGKEFAILSKEFSDSIMNPIDRAADSMLRVMDTATDTLYDAVASGENVGIAMRDALVQVTDDITKEITTDIMKQWNRDIMMSLFGIESDQAKKLRLTEEIARNTAKTAGVTPATPKEEDVTSPFDKIKDFFKNLFGIEDEIKKGTEVSKEIAVENKAANAALMEANRVNTEEIIASTNSEVLSSIYQELVLQTSKMCPCPGQAVGSGDGGTLSIGGFSDIGTDLSKPGASPEDILSNTNMIQKSSEAELAAANAAFLKSTAIKREHSAIFNEHKTYADYANQVHDLTYEELKKITQNTQPVDNIGTVEGSNMLNFMGEEQVGLQSDMVSNIMSGNTTVEEGILTSTQDSVNLANSLHIDNLGIMDSLKSLASSGIGSTIGSAIGGKYGSLIGGIVDIFLAKGGITNSLNRYATGTVTNGPELAMIGDNSSGKEAVVPLPSGEHIPVEFTGEGSGSGDNVFNTTINITGTDTNNADAVRRSAGQVAQAAGNATQRAMRRNG